MVGGGRWFDKVHHVGAQHGAECAKLQLVLTRDAAPRIIYC